MANKSKTRFNGIDLLFIIIVLGALIGIVMRYQLVDVITNSNGAESAHISFYLHDIKQTSEDYFSEGDRFFISDTGEFLGTLDGGFIFEPAEMYNSTIDGTLVKSNSVVGRSDMRGVFSSTGDFTNEGFLLGGTKYIAPGSNLTVQSGKVKVTIKITEIAQIH